MDYSNTNELIGDISTHQKNRKKQHKFYKSSMDLLGLLLWFQKKSGFCYASTTWLANKLGITTRSVLLTLKNLEAAGYILRSREGRRRVIICLIDKLPSPKRPNSKSKSSHVSKQKRHTFNSLYIEPKLHNTTQDVDVVIDALKKEGIKPSVCHSLAKKYSRQRIREVISASRKQFEISNKPGWIVKALAADFKFESGRIEEPPKYQLFQRQTQACNREGYKAGIAMIRERLGIVRG
jgi:biotin operon repressor